MSSIRSVLTDPIADLPDARLAQTGLSARFRNVECASFADAARYVMHLPYGRNTCRSDYHLVLIERKGTCSTKHALLGALARELGLAVELMLALYDMSEQNTPGVGSVLGRYGLDSLPEAHCFLRYNGKYVDVTIPPSEEATPKHLYQERVILPEDIGAMKEDFHRQALRIWARQQNHPDFELLWRVRNECIAALGK